jgi:hypothetical protein
MKRKNFFGLDQPLTHADHGKPMTRRDFVSQGFGFGAGIALGGSAFSLLGSSQAQAQLSTELQTLFETKCGGFSAANAKIPFICFDLAGGANFAGSNVLIGGAGGQRDFLSTSGYRKQGLPVDQTPNLDSAANPLIDESLGLLFHSDSGLLRGITEKATAAAPNINGAVIPARSENDTGNNPHNPMYQINKAGANGQLLALIGSRSSESGANSMAPAASINPEVRPTKVDRASDARGLVDTGQLTALLGNSQLDTDAVMESIYRLSNAKLGTVQTGLSQLPTTDEVVKDLVRCGYLQGALNAQQSPDTIDPSMDADIVGAGAIFEQVEYDNDREFQKTAAIMKLVIDGFAGAGTVTMGGYDYHTGDRATGEQRDLRAGRCIGACLEYARLRNKPLMVYVYSDGSVFSNGMIDNSAEGRGKGVWTGDNQQTAASFFLVHNPTGRPELVSPESQQLGYMRASGDVETTATPIANNVNLLVDAVALNYMALNGDIGGYQALFGNPFGSNAQMDSLVAFNALT